MALPIRNFSAEALTAHVSMYYEAQLARVAVGVCTMSAAAVARVELFAGK